MSEATATIEPVATAPAASTPETSQPAVQPQGAEAQVAEGQTEGATTAEGEASQGSASATVPEGMVFSASLMTELAPIFQEMELDKEQSQAFADIFAKVEAAQQEAAVQAKVDQGKAWEEELKADKEFGGAKYAENLDVANRGVAQFCTAKMIAMLAETGYANHPEFVRAFYKIGKELTEGSMVSGNVAGKDARTLDDVARRMFPTMTK